MADELSLLHEEYPIAKTYSADKKELDKDPQEVICEGHALHEQDCSQDMDSTGDGRCYDDSVQIVHSRISEHTFIQAKIMEHEKAENSIERGKAQKSREIRMEQFTQL